MVKISFSIPKDVLQSLNLSSSQDVREYLMDMSFNCRSEEVLANTCHSWITIATAMLKKKIDMTVVKQLLYIAHNLIDIMTRHNVLKNGLTVVGILEKIDEILTELQGKQLDDKVLEALATSMYALICTVCGCSKCVRKTQLSILLTSSNRGTRT